MATLISATPVLTGKEAERFHREALRNVKRKAPKKDVERAVKVFLAVMKNQDKNVFF